MSSQAGDGGRAGAQQTGGSAEGGVAAMTGSSGNGGAAPEPGVEGGVSGMAGEGSGGTSDDGSIVVSGRAVDAVQQPLVGKVVETQGQMVTTASDGSFEVQVTPPYDIVLRVGSLGTYAFLGVTRSDPTLRIDLSYALPHSATLQGQVTGGLTLPVPASKFTRVYVNSSFSMRSGLDVDADGSYGGLERTQWLGESTVNARLLAVQGDANGTTPAERTSALGIKPITLTSDASLQSPQTDVVLEPARFRALEVKLVFPDGAPDSCACALSLAPDLALHDLDCSTSTHHVEIPDLGAFELGLAVDGKVTDRALHVFQQVPSNAGSVSIRVPGSFPVVEGPLPNASGKARDLAFQVTPARDTVTWLAFNHEGEPANTFVLTTETRVELTRLLELGLDLPQGKAIGWSAQGRGGAATVDEHLAPAHDPVSSWSYFAGYPGKDWDRSFSYEPD